MKAKIVVTNNLMIGRNIWIDTPQWSEWLSVNNAFRYETEKTNFNCNRRGNGKWYASKKIYASNGCKLVALYIGADIDCTLERLKEISDRFSMSWADFWGWYHGPERKESRKSKGKVIHNPSGCITSVQNLQAELNRLKTQLDEVTQERDRLKEENLKLKAEVEMMRSDVGVSGQENDQDIPPHCWSIGAIQPRSVLIRKSYSRRQFEKQGNYPILPDGSKWRRIGSKQELPESERYLSLHQYYPANTVLYLCIG